MSIELIPLGQLEHGENARQTQNPKHIAELASSIKEKGLKQNLQGSRKGKAKSTKVRIHAGHSRLEALVLLKLQKAVGHDGRKFDDTYEVPVLVEKLSHEEALEASLIENIQRENLHPWEEAQAFHALVNQHGFSPEEVALRSGKSLEAVTKRLFLVTNLCGEAKGLLASNQIGLVQAQALAAVPLDTQPRLLERYGNEISASLIQSLIKGQNLETSRAIFPLEEYRKRGGVILEDMYKQLPPYFSDPKLVAQMQEEAAQALTERLGKKWAWAKLTTEPHHDWEYQTTKNKREGGAVVYLNPRTLEVKVYEGLVRVVRPSQPSRRSPIKRNALTKGGVALTKALKSQAMQYALLHHPTCFHLALALNILGLLGATEVHLGFTDPNPLLKQTTLHPALQNLFEQIAPSLGLKYSPDPSLRPRLGYHSQQSSEVLGALLRQPTEVLQNLFIALTASAIGTWTTAGLDDPAEDAFALELAEHLEARVSATSLSDDWLKTVSKDRLMEIYNEVSQTPLVGSFTSKQLRGLILERVKAKTDYLPKELTFHRTSHLLPATDEESIEDGLEDQGETLEDAEIELESAA